MFFWGEIPSAILRCVTDAFSLRLTIKLTGDFMRENELYFLIKCNSLLRKKNRCPSFDRTDHIKEH